MARNVTLLDLVNAVVEHAGSEAEVIATIVYMVNQGHVRLCGMFKGARFDVKETALLLFGHEIELVSGDLAA